MPTPSARRGAARSSTAGAKRGGLATAPSPSRPLPEIPHLRPRPRDTCECRAPRSWLRGKFRSSAAGRAAGGIHRALPRSPRRPLPAGTARSRLGREVTAVRRSLAAFPYPQPGGREGDFSFRYPNLMERGKRRVPAPGAPRLACSGAAERCPAPLPAPFLEVSPCPASLNPRRSPGTDPRALPILPPDPSALPGPGARSPWSLYELGAVPKRRAEPLRVRLPRGRRYNRASLRSQAAAAAGQGPCPRRGAESQTRRRPP